jgi:hypothetical protein
LLIVIVLFYPWLYLSVVSLSKFYSPSEMDWNADGHLSLKEFLEAGDIEKDKHMIDGKAYLRYWSLRDGMTVKITSKDKNLKIKRIMVDNEKEHHPAWQIIEDDKIVKVEY